MTENYLSMLELKILLLCLASRLTTNGTCLWHPALYLEVKRIETKRGVMLTVIYIFRYRYR